MRPLHPSHRPTHLARVESPIERAYRWYARSRFEQRIRSLTNYADRFKAFLSEPVLFWVCGSPECEDGPRGVGCTGAQHRGWEVRVVRRVRIVLGFQGKTIALPVSAVARSIQGS